MSITISVRVEDQIKEDIEKLGYTPGDFTKRALMKELKRVKHQNAMDYFKENPLPPGEEPVEVMIRRDRDSI